MNRCGGLPSACTRPSHDGAGIEQNRRMRKTWILGWMAGAFGLWINAAAAPLEEVPFITTPDRVTRMMLELAEVGPQDRLIDLGSGDGRIVITAARLHGASGLGVEIVPDLVQRSREAAQRAGVADRARFEVRDLFETDLSAATVITMYLLPDVNLKLRPRLLALQPGTRIVSHDWDLGDWQPDRTVTVEVPDKAVGRERFSRVHLWRVPAPVQGLWCAPGQDRPVLALQAQHQRVRAEAGLEGWIRGVELELTASAGGLRARWLGPGQMRILSATGAWAAWAGLELQSATSAACPGGLR